MVRVLRQAGEKATRCRSVVRTSGARSTMVTTRPTMTNRDTSQCETKSTGTPEPPSIRHRLRGATTMAESHHGSTPAAWTAVTLCLIAFCVGAVGLVIDNWVVFWIGAALVVVAGAVGKIMQAMGLGAR